MYKECGSQSEVMPKGHPHISTTVNGQKSINKVQLCLPPSSKKGGEKQNNCNLELNICTLVSDFHWKENGVCF